jgi:DNA/RNA endonuclease YhcR with UshA esterase domain
MDENLLLKISLIFSILGVFTILFISESTTLPITKISDIAEDKIDQKIKINGKITNVVDTPEIIIANIKDETGTITVIIFKNNETKIFPLNLFQTPENIPLKNYQIVEIEGTIMSYQGNLEISADEIKSK